MDVFFVVKACLCLVLLVCCIPASVGVQCFYCNGVTRYDPNNCWHPSEENTILMECAKGDWCEKKVARVDSKHESIERGCSSNCDGRSYVYTEQFNVHCCNGNMCNQATSAMATSVATVVVLATGVALWVRR